MGSRKGLALLLAAAVLASAAQASSVDVRVLSSTDDAEQLPDHSMYLNSSDLELTYDGGTQVVGVRWLLGVPSGATVTAAWVQFSAKEPQSEATSLSFQAQAADDAPSFAFGTDNISARPRTLAFASWQPPAWSSGLAGPDQRTPDLSAVVQEVVSRPGWAGHLALIITGTGHRTAWAWDGDPSQAPLLHVEYSSALLEPFTVAYYTVPAFQAAADTLCDGPGAPEVMGSVEIWWWPMGGSPYLRGIKNVAGLEGQRDTLHVPVSPMGLAKVVAIDAAGNRACETESDWVGFNESGAVGVGTPPLPHLLPRGPMFWFDIAGRRIRELDGLTYDQVRDRGHSGVLLARPVDGRHGRKLVILH
jgi:hypothetical protein